jgi:leukotriene-A4 hydrolase
MFPKLCKSIADPASACSDVAHSFDTSDLEILRAEVEGSVCQHQVKPKHEVMGSALHIPLPAGLKSGTAISVAVFYKTTKDCTALQWLEKEYGLS